MTHDTQAPPPATVPTAEPRLSRSLGVGGNVLITLSSISPASSVFIVGGAALTAYGTGVFWAFLIAGVISILIAFCYADLASSYPVAGGDYSLVSRALGPTFGIADFFINLISLPLIVAVFGLGVADYLGVAIGGLSPLATGLVMVAVATITACFNIRTNAWVTGIFMFIEFAALLLLTVLGVVHISRPFTDLLAPQVLATAGGHLVPITVVGMMLAVTQGVFAYNGYSGSVYFAEETRNAQRTIAKAVLWSAVATMAAELIPLTAILWGTADLPRLFGNALPINMFLAQRSNHLVTVVVLVAVAFAIINAMIAIALQAGRMLYTAARDGAMPLAIARPLAKVSPKSHVPVVATAVMGVIALLACFVPMDVLLNATGSTVVFTYLFIAVAALANHRKAKPAGAYRMPWWPIPPAVGLAILVVVFVMTAMDPTQWTSLAIAIGLVVAGFVYYALYVRPRRGTQFVLLDAVDDEADDAADHGMPVTVTIEE